MSNIIIEGLSTIISLAVGGLIGYVVSRFGGNQPHNNMPPYYVLAYIMKM